MDGLTYRAGDEVPEFTGPDGARIRELAGRETGLISHSLAIITHPAGMTTIDHHHTMVDEVYYVQSGRGHVRIDGEVKELATGDTVIIRPGQRHKLWADAGEALVLVVTCAPAYSVTEVIWDE